MMRALPSPEVFTDSSLPSPRTATKPGYIIQSFGPNCISRLAGPRVCKICSRVIPGVRGISRGTGGATGAETGAAGAEGPAAVGATPDGVAAGTTDAR